MAPDAAREVVVNDFDSGKELLRFEEPQDGSDVLGALEIMVGRPGILRNPDGLVFTRSNRNLTPGAYTFFAPVAASTDTEKGSETESWGVKLAAVMVALFVLTVLPQGLVALAFAAHCDFRWHCTFQWFRAFINYIDGPFKILAFTNAIMHAWNKPEKWIGRGSNSVGSGAKLEKVQKQGGGKKRVSDRRKKKL